MVYLRVEYSVGHERTGEAGRSDTADHSPDRFAPLEFCWGNRAKPQSRTRWPSQCRMESLVLSMQGLAPLAVQVAVCRQTNSANSKIHEHHIVSLVMPVRVASRVNEGRKIPAHQANWAVGVPEIGAVPWRHYAIP